MAKWASEIGLSSLVGLNENVSLLNDNFQSEATVFQNSRLQPLSLKHRSVTLFVFVL